jgi:large subunit ribosomal protein L11
MQKKATIKLILEAQNVSFSTPLIAPTLGQFGINIKQFCDLFNNRTKFIKQGTPLVVNIILFTDNSFDFMFQTPPTSYFFTRSIKPQSSAFKYDLSLKAIYEIALIKQKDFTHLSLASICRMILGSARSKGLSWGVVN